MRRLAPLVLILAGCDNGQLATGRDGVQSDLFTTLFWGFVVVLVAVYAVVFAFLLASVLRRRGGSEDAPDDA